MPKYKAKQVLRDLEKNANSYRAKKEAIKNSETLRRNKLQSFRRISGGIFRSVSLKRFIDS